MNTIYFTEEMLSTDFTRSVHIHPSTQKIEVCFDLSNNQTKTYSIDYAYIDNIESIIVYDNIFGDTILGNVNNFSVEWNYRNGNLRYNTIVSISFDKTTKEVIEFFNKERDSILLKCKDTVLTNSKYSTMHDYYLEFYGDRYSKLLRENKIDDFLK